MTPAVRRLLREHGLSASAIAGTGGGGRITREDVTDYVESQRTGQPVGKQNAAAAPGQAAAQVEAGGYWNSICSVRVTLVFTNKINPASGPISFSRVIAVMKTAGANS